MNLALSKTLSQESIQKRFDDLLGDKAQAFISSLMQVCNNNYLLSKADPKTILNAAVTAATLDLPINPNLGYAYIVPYKGAAQFQIGWKGFVQLALRTNQYKRINVTEVYENQFESYNTLTEDLIGDFSLLPEGDVVGYASYFKLSSGFEKTVYWPIGKVKKHASKYSQTYGKNNKSGKLIYSPWNDPFQFDSMACKTVVKHSLSKWGIMSVDMDRAYQADQSVQKDEEQYSYPDNTIEIESQEDKDKREELKRVKEFIAKAKDVKSLQLVEQNLTKEGRDIKEYLDLIAEAKALIIEKQMS